MNVAIAAIDLVTAALFLTAAIVSIATSRLTKHRTQFWGFVTSVYLLLFVERMLNTLEWGLGSTFALVDTVEDYFAVAACLILLIVAARFLRLVHPHPARGV